MQHKCIYKYLYTVQRTMKFISICFIILISNLVDAQTPETNPDKLRTKNWTIGNNILLEFGDSVKVGSSSVHTSEAYASFSTKSGKLLYYSDAVNLYDSNHSVISALKGDKSSVQGVLISGNDSLINVLTTTDIGRKNGAHFYTFKSGVKVQDKRILNPVCEMQSRVKHANQRDEWIALHKFKSDSIYLFLVKKEKILCPSVFKSQNYFGDNGSNAVGSMKFSPSGKLFFINHYLFKNDVNGNGENELYSFNNELGQLSFKYSTGNIRLPISGEFSTHENALFVSERGGSILRYEISDGNQSEFRLSKKIIWTGPNFSSEARLQKHGNRILINLPDSNHLAEISNSDSTSTKVIFSKYSIDLNGKIQSYGLPVFNASCFYTPSIDFAYTEDCWEHAYSFEGRDTLNATSWKWIFEKGSVSDSLFTKHCKYTFPDTGKWEVSHIASTATRSDTVTKTLTIRPQWQQDALGKDTFYCTGDSINLTLQAPIDMHCIHWNDEEPNLDESLGEILDYDHFHIDTLLVDTAGTYIVKLTNKTFCQMWDTITIREEASPSKSVINRSGRQLESSIVAAEYRWYFNGSLKNTTTESKLTPDSNGYWQVKLVSEFGCESELSDSFNVGFAGIDKRYETLDLRFEIYPNPSDGNITIAVPKGGDYQVLIYDMTGKLIYNTSQSLSLIFELELELVSGTYIITLTDDSGHKGSQKIEVVK
jgi:PKD repeat protein